MCVDVDLSLDADDRTDPANGASHVLQALDKSALEAPSMTWLELDELGIDDHMLLSLTLSHRFPVSTFSFPYTPTYSNNFGHASQISMTEHYIMETYITFS